MRPTRRILAGLAVLAIVATPAAAQDNGVAGGLFEELAGNEATARTTLEAWFGTVPAEHEPIYVAYLQGLAADPAVVTYIVGRTGQPTDPSTYLAGPARSAVLDATNNGVRLLTSEQQAAYYDFARDTFTWVAANDQEGCRTMLVGGGNAPGEDAAIPYMNAYQATLPAADVAAILDLSRTAFMAIVTDAAPANAFTDAQLTEGLDAYRTTLLAAVNGAPNGAELAAAAARLGEATPAQACSIGVMSLDVLLDLPAPQRDYAVQALANQL
ncbi:MAG: hypothetical protein AB7O56_13715 [Bauldia sp.]